MNPIFVQYIILLMIFIAVLVSGLFVFYIIHVCKSNKKSRHYPNGINYDEIKSYTYDNSTYLSLRIVDKYKVIIHEDVFIKKDNVWREWLTGRDCDYMLTNLNRLVMEADKI